MKSSPGGHPINLAWAQLSHEKSRLLIAMAGIAFADMLMFIQLGFQNALYDSNTRLHQSINADLVLLSPQARNLVNLETLPRRRLYQALSFPGVRSAEPLYTDYVTWKTPQTQRKTSILLLGIDPEYPAFSIPGLEQKLDSLKLPDTLLFDRGSRGDYAQTLAAIDAGATVTTEIGDRKNVIRGLFRSGASFATDGNAVTSDLNFHRILSNRRHPSQISAGLIRLKPGTDPGEMARVLQAYLPSDVRVLTKAEFIDFEKQYWSENTSIGFIFNLGTGIGFIVGVVIVYQILSSDVADHTAEYATLKAMGYPNRYLLGVVFQEAVILAIFGFIPGSAIAIGLYSLTRNATNLPLYMTLGREMTVLLLTLTMCLMSGALATRKLRAADPADIF
jgi:putative ABC transport system permease protein